MNMLQSVIEFFTHLNNLNELIRWGGYTALVLIVFAETGLFFGFFLPGDSLLVTAGLFAAKGDLNIVALFFLLAGASILGDAVNFEVGRFSGKRIFSKPQSRFFNPKHLHETHAFYEKHGGKTIIMARFMPVVRSFAPLVAGASNMSYPQFAMFNVIGGVTWAGSMLGIGYILGRSIPNIDQYIHFVIAIVIFLSLLPAIIHYFKCYLRKTA